MTRFFSRPLLLTAASRSRLNRSSPSAIATASEANHALTLPQVSNRSLDMCMLAICSCVLSLMCHQTGSLVNVSAMASGASASSTPSSALQVDFVVKAGLVTSRQQSEQDVEDA